MKCIYQDCECRYANTTGMSQTKVCESCELYPKDAVRISRGCAEPTIAILIIIILLLI